MNSKDFDEQQLDLLFLKWAEETHPVIVNNLREAYSKYKEMIK